jgi:hypothetical protein
MECGEFSPLSAGDLSLSKRLRLVVERRACSRERSGPLGTRMPTPVDGDKSPAASGD